MKLIEQNAIFSELKLRSQNESNKKTFIVKEEDVQRWSAVFSISRSALYDSMALYLARGFNKNELSFEFCDWVVNDIHGVISIKNEIRPELFWEAFLAFDAGESYHAGDNRSEDPIEKYTRPLIVKLLTRISSHEA